MLVDDFGPSKLIIFAVSKALVILGFLLFLFYFVLTGSVFRICIQSLATHHYPGPSRDPLRILFRLFSEEALLHSEPSSGSLWTQSKSQFYRPLFSVIPHLLPPFLDKFSFSLPLWLQQLLQPFLSANKPQAFAVSISSSWITVSRLQD